MGLLWLFGDQVDTRYSPFLVGPVVALVFTVITVCIWPRLPTIVGVRQVLVVGLGFLSLGLAGIFCTLIHDPNLWLLGSLWAVSRLLDCPALAVATMLWGVVWSEVCLPRPRCTEAQVLGLNPSPDARPNS